MNLFFPSKFKGISSTWKLMHGLSKKLGHYCTLLKTTLFVDACSPSKLKCRCTSQHHLSFFNPPPPFPKKYATSHFSRRAHHKHHRENVKEWEKTYEFKEKTIKITQTSIFFPLGKVGAAHTRFSDHLPGLLPWPWCHLLLPYHTRDTAQQHHRIAPPISISLSLSPGLKNPTRPPDAHCSSSLPGSLPLLRFSPGAGRSWSYSSWSCCCCCCCRRRHRRRWSRRWRVRNGEGQPRLLRPWLRPAPAATLARLRRRAEGLHLEDTEW